MTERLSHELAFLLAEDDGRLDRGEARDLLRARLARSVYEGLAQGPREHAGAEAGMIDHARVAAYLDCSVSRAEREAIAVELAGDPAVRSDMASAVLLLGGIEAQPAAIPKGLLARAAGILAAAQPIGPSASAAWRVPIATWWRRPAAWSGLAAVLLVAALTPAIVSMVRERNEASSVRGLPVERGVAPSPARKEKDIRSCDDPGEPAKKLSRRPGEAETSADRGARTADRPGEPSSAAPDDDPCRPKPAIEDDHKPSARPR